MAERRDFFFGLCMVLLSSFLTIQSFRYPADSSLFPRFLAVLLLALSLLLFMRTLKQSRKVKVQRPPLKVSPEWLKSTPVRVFGATAAYIAMTSVLGFIVSTALFIFGVISFLDRKRWKTGLLYGVCYSLILYAAFRFVLGATLPSGWLI